MNPYHHQAHTHQQVDSFHILLLHHNDHHLIVLFGIQINRCVHGGRAVKQCQLTVSAIAAKCARIVHFACIEACYYVTIVYTPLTTTIVQ
jgi:hypothetical protein